MPYARRRCNNGTFSEASVILAANVQTMKFGPPLTLPKPKKRTVAALDGAFSIVQLATKDAVCELFGGDDDDGGDDEDDAAGGITDDTTQDVEAAWLSLGGGDVPDFTSAGASVAKNAKEFFAVKGQAVLKEWLTKEGTKRFASMKPKLDAIAAKAKEAVSELNAAAQEKVAVLNEKFDVKMFMAVLQQGTDYDLEGGMSSVRKVLSMKPVHLAKELKEIEYLLDRLAKAEEPFTAVSAAFSQPPLLCCVCIVSISTSPNPPYACALVIFPGLMAGHDKVVVRDA